MFRKRDVLLSRELKTRFIVTVKNGPTFSGVLVYLDERTFQFAEVKLIQSDGALPAEGQLFISRNDVAYLQRVIITEE